MGFFEKAKVFSLVGLIVPLVVLVVSCGTSDAPEEVAVTTKFSGEEMMPSTVEARQGDTVSLTIESDQPGTFHLHGYDLTGEAKAAEPAEIQFTANATGRFALTFHGDPGGAGAATSGEGAGSGKATAMDHGPMESESAVSLDISAQVDDDGGTHIFIETEGWRWAPEEVNLANRDGAGHAHVYADGVKLGRIYGPYHYLPSLEPGTHEIMVNLNSNAHDELTWQGTPLEATTTITVPEGKSAETSRLPGEPGWVASDEPMSLAIVPNPDPLGGYNLQIMPQGFEFSPGSGLPHEPGSGYAQVEIDGEFVTRAYVPWLKLPALGEGMHTFSVRLVNNEGAPYQYDGKVVEDSAQVHEEAKEEQAAGDGSGGQGHHASGGAAGAGSDHHSQAGSSAGGGIELEVGYLEVLPR